MPEIGVQLRPKWVFTFDRNERSRWSEIRTMIRRGRGYRDHEYLILKVQKATAQARLARAA